MLRTRLALIAWTAFASTACVEDPRPTHRPRSSPEENPRAPASIGYEDGAVPQVHIPPRFYPPTVSPQPIALGPRSALTSLPNGGALLLWASPMNTPRPMSQLALRSISPDGMLGPMWTLRRSLGTVRGIDIAMRGDSALMIWNSEIGSMSSQIFAERVRPDGTLINSPFGVGTYRVIDPNVPDAGMGGDRLGFPARVVATATGFAIAVRGTLARCGSALCPSIRVANVDPYDVIVGRGGLENPDPAEPITLLGSQQTPFSLAVNFGVDHGPGHIETFGPGPLTSLGLHDGALVVAWLHAGSARAIVRLAPTSPRGAPRLEVRGLSVADAGTGWPVEHVSLGCEQNVAAVAISGASGTVSVRIDEPGASEVFAWALDFVRAASVSNGGTRGPRVAPAPIAPDDHAVDATWIRDGLIVSRPSRIEMMRCSDTVLGPPITLPWTAEAGDAAVADDVLH